MFPVTVKVPVTGLYSSALGKKETELREGEPPTMSTIPLLSSVAVCERRPVFRLFAKMKPGVTVRVSGPLLTPVIEAVICVVPRETPLARPLLPIVATPGAEELHVAIAVRSCVLLSL
jgi:hypothetical protein